MKVKWRNETANYIQVANAIKVIKIRRHNLKIIGRTAPDPDVCENNTSFQFLNQIFFFGGKASMCKCLWSQLSNVTHNIAI